MFNYRRHLIRKPFRPFIMKVNSGANSQLTILTSGGGYNYDLSSSDGQSWAGLTGSHTITFPSANTDYFIEITGEMGLMRFGNELNQTEKDKFKELVQFGDVKWSGYVNGFRSLREMIVTATDTPNLQGITSLATMYYICSLFDADINNYDYSSIENITNFISNCIAFNKEINIKLPNVTIADYALRITTSLTKPVKIEFDKYVNVREIIRDSGTKDIELIFNNGCSDFGNNCFINTNPDRLILNGATGSFNITYFGANFGIIAIHNLFTSLGTANTGATITLTEAQRTSGINTAIATAKGWTIIVV